MKHIGFDWCKSCTEQPICTYRESYKDPASLLLVTVICSFSIPGWVAFYELCRHDSIMDPHNVIPSFRTTSLFGVPSQDLSLEGSSSISCLDPNKAKGEEVPCPEGERAERHTEPEQRQAFIRFFPVWTCHPCESLQVAVRKGCSIPCLCLTDSPGGATKVWQGRAGQGRLPSLFPRAVLDFTQD